MSNKFVTVIAVTLIITVSAVFSFKMYLEKNRFQINTTSKGKVYKTDTKTGEVWEIKAGNEVLLKEPEPKKPIKVVPLTFEELSKLDGTLGPGLSFGNQSTTKAELNLYNGNNFWVHSVIVEINFGGSYRQFDVELFEPLSSTQRTFDTGMSMTNKKFTWNIISANKHN